MPVDTSKAPRRGLGCSTREFEALLVEIGDEPHWPESRQPDLALARIRRGPLDYHKSCALNTLHIESLMHGGRYVRRTRGRTAAARTIATCALQC